MLVLNYIYDLYFDPFEAYINDCWNCLPNQHRERRVEYDLYFNALGDYLKDFLNRCPKCQDITCIAGGSWSCVPKQHIETIM